MNIITEKILNKIKEQFWKISSYDLFITLRNFDNTIKETDFCLQEYIGIWTNWYDWHKLHNWLYSQIKSGDIIYIY